MNLGGSRVDIRRDLMVFRLDVMAEMDGPKRSLISIINHLVSHRTLEIYNLINGQSAVCLINLAVSMAHIRLFWHWMHRRILCRNI